MTALRGLRLVRDILFTVFFFGAASLTDTFSWIDVVFFAVFMLFVWWLDAQGEKRAALSASAIWSRELRTLRDALRQGDDS